MKRLICGQSSTSGRQVELPSEVLDRSGLAVVLAEDAQPGPVARGQLPDDACRDLGQLAPAVHVGEELVQPADRVPLVRPRQEGEMEAEDREGRRQIRRAIQEATARPAVRAHSSSRHPRRLTILRCGGVARSAIPNVSC